MGKKRAERHDRGHCSDQFILYFAVFLILTEALAENHDCNSPKYKTQNGLFRCQSGNTPP